jgi:hypothetical protein
VLVPLVQESTASDTYTPAHPKLKHEPNPQAKARRRPACTYVYAQAHDSPTLGAHPCPRRLRRTAAPHPEHRPEAHAHTVPVHLTKPKLKLKCPELEPEDKSLNASSARSSAGLRQTRKPE